MGINKEVGETGTLVKRGDLEFVLEKAGMSKNILKAAAILLHDIIQAHPFINGNKRTAFQAMRAFLVLNGKKLVYDPSNEKLMESLLYEIAQNKISRNKTESILEKMIE